jgi:uncharacterized membrane protein YccF (DUF307 family)
METMIRILLALVVGGFIVSFGLAIMLGVIDFPIQHDFKPLVIMQDRLVDTFGIVGSALIFVLTGLVSAVFFIRLPFPPPSDWRDTGDSVLPGGRHDDDASGGWDCDGD